MRILITGGTGYIGSHTAVNLLLKNHELFVLDNYCNSSEEVLDKIKTITKKDFLSATCDIREKSKLIKIFSVFNPEIVIHFAGLKAVNESVKNPLNYYSNNIAGTINLLEVMQQFNCNKIIFSSSATVYGNPLYFPCDEKHQIFPINPYGRSKYFIEQIIKDWTLSKDKNKSVILRYFNPVGAHKSGIIGESPTGIPNNLFPFILGVISKKYKYLSIFGNDYDTLDGTGVRDYVHVEDISMAHANSLDLFNTSTKNQIINLGTGIGYSVLEIIKEFEKVIEKRIPFKIKTRRIGDAAIVVADNKKAKSILKWKIKNNLNDICKDTIKWMNNYG